MEQQKDIFISYGRGNANSPGSKAFTFSLSEKLQQQGYKIWLDKNDIPLATDYQNEIDKGIESSNNFAFIISPHSAKSIYCFKEIEKAVSLNKRIIPILHIPPDQEAVDESLHPTVKQLNWLHFQDSDDQEKALQEFKSVLELDMDHLNYHTHFLYKAKEWESKNYRKEFYLSGKELKEAETWIQQATAQKTDPPPTDLHIDFIRRSRRRIRNTKLTTSLTAIALLLITALSAVAGWYSYQEKLALQESIENLQASKSNALLTSAYQIACDYSKKQSLPVIAMAYRTAPKNQKAAAAFYGSYYNTFPAQQIQAPSGLIFTPEVSPPDQQIKFSSESGMIYVYGEEGEVLSIIDGKGKTISGLAYDEASNTLYAQTLEGEALAYPLKIDALIEGFDTKNVPHMSDEILKRYGITPEYFQKKGGKISATDKSLIQSIQQPEKEAADVAPAKEQEEETPAIPQQETPDEPIQNAPVEELSNAMSFDQTLASEDVAELASGWKQFYAAYQQQPGTGQGREALEKAVKLAEKASYLAPNNTKLMATLGKGSGELAWEYLLAGQPEKAIYYSKQGMVVAPKQEWMLKYLMLGYLYNGQVPQAMEVVSAIKNLPYVFDDRYPTFNDAALADLNQLERNGQIAQQADKIREGLAVELRAGYVEINEGVQSVNSATVKLKLFARGASEMVISNVPNFTDNARWEPYKLTRQWKLVPSQGIKYVYAKFRNAKGEESQVVRAKVNLLDIR